MILPPFLLVPRGGVATFASRRPFYQSIAEAIRLRNAACDELMNECLALQPLTHGQSVLAILSIPVILGFSVYLNTLP